MEELMQPDRLRASILLWAEEEVRLGELPPKAGTILEAILYRGELPRGDADTLVGTGERQARRIVASLLAKRVLKSKARAPHSGLHFPRRSRQAGCQAGFQKDHLRKAWWTASTLNARWRESSPMKRPFDSRALPSRSRNTAGANSSPANAIRIMALTPTPVQKAHRMELGRDSQRP